MTLAKTPLATFALALSAVSAHAAIKRVGWVGKDSYGPAFHQNVTAKDMKTLLAGHAFVAEFQDGRTTHALQIYWFGRDGIETFCTSDAAPGKNLGTYYPVHRGPWKSVTVDRASTHVNYPMVSFPMDYKGKGGWVLYRYDAVTGGLTGYGAFGQGAKLRWWRLNTGRLQKELPAVTWKLCPDFPSAASLGATVDPRQTATDYDTVIRQGGTPILRPDLVTSNTVIPYGAAASVSGMHRLYKFLAAHSGEVLVAPDHSDYVYYAPSGTIWHLGHGKQVIMAGNLEAAATPPMIDWADGSSQPVNASWVFKPTGQRYPLTATYDAILGHPLNRAVGPLPAGAVLDDYQVVTVPGAKGKSGYTWTSWGDRILLAGPFGYKTVPAKAIAAATR